MAVAPPMMISLRWSRRAGLVAPVVALGLILVATVVSPTFTWAGSALSDLGVAPATAPLFNAGLLLGGVLGLGYLPALRRASSGRLGTGVTATFALAMAAMAGVGLFPAGDPLHVPAALAFYLLLTATLALDGIDRRGSRDGRIALALAGLHVLGWTAWLAGLRPGPGLALPEFWGALLFAAWVVAASPAAPLRDEALD